MRLDKSRQWVEFSLRVIIDLRFFLLQRLGGTIFYLRVRSMLLMEKVSDRSRSQFLMKCTHSWLYKELKFLTSTSTSAWYKWNYSKHKTTQELKFKKLFLSLFSSKLSGNLQVSFMKTTDILFLYSKYLLSYSINISCSFDNLRFVDKHFVSRELKKVCIFILYFSGLLLFKFRSFFQINS